ncbi:hypothetical protein HETIRDRAFT_388630 [Heterobasidion irregulare TC 32-1]|uniref:Uncharacterized protein n=1 Tax=Heterobasidion irregulare (strain TC 32-1) TaxID=747525 RepID=W4JU55_HETIT|nr:uncharacterized protein HETIRDRAFT_388630 [Heterobasidion irregulare TC 32-1]ETW77088.1 hypothetical protein HETIRDRAFT_388630 [Heterobasidion irregulare TC 32-1]
MAIWRGWRRSGVVCSATPGRGLRDWTFHLARARRPAACSLALTAHFPTHTRAGACLWPTHSTPTSPTTHPPPSSAFAAPSPLPPPPLRSHIPPTPSALRPQRHLLSTRGHRHPRAQERHS